MSLGGCGLTGQASIAGAACEEQCLFSQSLFDEWADAERRLFRRLPDCAAAVPQCAIESSKERMTEHASGGGPPRADVTRGT